MYVDMAKRAILFLNGQHTGAVADPTAYDTIACADGGYTLARACGLVPDYVIGDLDTIRREGIDVLPSTQTIYRPDQNSTDMHKSLQFLYEHGETEVDVYGAMGKEADHFVGNLVVARRFYKKMSLRFVYDEGEFFFLPKTFSRSGIRGKTVSLLPFPRAVRVHSTGLRYPLNGITLSITGTIGTRNVADSDQVRVSFQKGDLLFFLSR